MLNIAMLDGAVALDADGKSSAARPTTKTKGDPC
jgi:hypothetical protein